jgi:hypothetical protein
MSLDTYDVYFSGSLLKDADPEEAKRKIGAMFKLEGEKLERLFSGKPIPIKRGVDMDRAVKFRVAFRDAGALVDIVPEGQPAPNPAARPTPPQRPAAPIPPARPAPAAAQPTEAAAAVQPDASDLSLADDGPLPTPAEPEVNPVEVPDYGLSAPKDFNLSNCTPEVEAAPLPDISAMHLDKEGAVLDETPDAEPLEIDTEALELDEPGATLIDTEEVPPPEIDTHQLSMSAPREGSLEAYQKPVEPAPVPDTAHLKLEEGESKEKSQGKAQFVIADD